METVTSISEIDKQIDKLLNSIDEPKVVGVILNIGENKVPQGMSLQEFINKCTGNIEHNIPAQDMYELQFICKYYDETTGQLYIHFDRLLSESFVKLYFKDSEIIYQLEN